MKKNWVVMGVELFLIWFCRWIHFIWWQQMKIWQIVWILYHMRQHEWFMNLFCILDWCLFFMWFLKTVQDFSSFQNDYEILEMRQSCLCPSFQSKIFPDQVGSHQAFMLLHVTATLRCLRHFPFSTLDNHFFVASLIHLSVRYIYEGCCMIYILDKSLLSVTLLPSIELHIWKS